MTDHPAMHPTTTAVLKQLGTHPDLAARLSPLRRRVVVLERIARGGGATRWYLGRTPEECRRIYRLLWPGSRVTFYFAGPLRVDPLGDRVIGAMCEAVGEAREIVVGVPDVEGALQGAGRVGAEPAAAGPAAGSSSRLSRSVRMRLAMSRSSRTSGALTE